MAKKKKKKKSRAKNHLALMQHQKELLTGRSPTLGYPTSRSNGLPRKLFNKVEIRISHIFGKGVSYKADKGHAVTKVVKRA